MKVSINHFTFTPRILLIAIFAEILKYRWLFHSEVCRVQESRIAFETVILRGAADRSSPHLYRSWGRHQRDRRLDGQSGWSRRSYNRTPGYGKNGSSSTTSRPQLLRKAFFYFKARYQFFLNLFSSWFSDFLWNLPFKYPPPSIKRWK